MEKRQNVLLAGLQHALHKEDLTGNESKTFSSVSDSGSSTVKVDPFDQKDFIMMHNPELGVVNEVPYTESRLDGPGGIKGKPIHEGSDPERCMVIMGLPKPKEGWTLSMRLQKVDGSADDTISFTTINGNYSTLYAEMTKLQKPVHECAGLFFTIKTPIGTFETYQNINQPDQVVVLSYAQENSFDAFQVSILGQANR